MNLSTLNRYLIRFYLEKFLMVLGIIIAALLLSNIFDILNKTRNVTIGINVFVNLALLKIPYLISELLPIAAMLAMFLTNYMLTKYRELVVLCGSGISIFSILAPISICVFMIGVFFTMFINPISTQMLSKYENMESKIINKKPYNIVLSDKGIIISETCESDKKIYIVKSLNIKQKHMRNVTVILTDKSNNFKGRINAKSGKLCEGFIVLNKLSMYDEEGRRSNLDSYQIKTGLAIDNFVEGIKPPDHLNFWMLPEAIYNLKNAGLPVIKHQLYFYKILFRPLVMVAFVFLASCFIYKDNRSKRSMPVTILGLICGFAAYLVLQISANMLVYNGVSPVIAIALQALIVILLSAFAILHLRID